MVAISALTHRQTQYLERAVVAAREYARDAGRPVHIVCGGAPAAATSGRFLKAGADSIVVGEGERTFTELIDCIAAGGSLEKVAGLILPAGTEQSAAPKEGEFPTKKTPARPLVQDLDELPMPAWDLADLPAYLKRTNGSFSPVLTSRGCPFACFYCLHSRKYRAHSPKRVVDEFEHLVKHYGVSTMEIVDEIFNCRKDRVVAIGEEMKRRSLRVNLTDYDGLRADILTEDVVDALAAMGFIACSVAVESASPRLQKLIKKELNIERTIQAIDWLTKRRIFVNAFFMVGFPTEEPHEIVRTLNFARDCASHQSTIAKVEVYRGTPMWDFAIEQGMSPEEAAGLSRFNLRGQPGYLKLPEETLQSMWERGVWDVYNNVSRMQRIRSLTGPIFAAPKYKKFYSDHGLWAGDFPALYEDAWRRNDLGGLVTEASRRFLGGKPALEGVFERAVAAGSPAVQPRS